MHADLQHLVDHFKARRDFKVQDYLERKVEALNDFFRREKLDSVVLGISGGVDSAVVLALLDRAMKTEGSPLKCIWPLAMPMGNTDGVTGQATASIKGRLLCDALGYSFTLVNLGDTYRAVLDASPRRVVNDQRPWVEGQMASVLRTPVLYYHAAILQADGLRSLVAGTTNRDEGAYLGFFGKASDAMVDLQPIADLHKSEVYQLAELLDIPVQITQDAPRGDVWDNRNDEQMIGAPYWFVETYLQMKQEGFLITPRWADYPEELSIWLNQFQSPLSPESHALFTQYATAIEKLHQTNAHKYRVGSPARFVDVLDRAIPGGWKA